MINARMRNGSKWSDLSILNMSSRGLMGRSPEAPKPGSYVEVRRGQHVIVARVVWTDEQLFGVSTQDVLPIDDILEGRCDSTKPEAGSAAIPERRHHRRAATLPTHERSRQLARMVEFSFILALGSSVAVAAAATVQDALATPFATIAATFDATSNPSSDSTVRQNP
jgi:Flp pilus assembly pilin Flp